MILVCPSVNKPENQFKPQHLNNITSFFSLENCSHFAFASSINFALKTGRALLNFQRFVFSDYTKLKLYFIHCSSDELQKCDSKLNTKSVHTVACESLKKKGSLLFGMILEPGFLICPVTLALF